MIVGEILLMKEKGERLNHAYVAGRNRKLTVAAVSHFGSWRKAVEAAGINYLEECISLDWTDRDIIEGIQKLKVDGADLISSIACERNRRLFRAGVNRWRD